MILRLFITLILIIPLYTFYGISIYYIINDIKYKTENLKLFYHILFVIVIIIKIFILLVVIIKINSMDYSKINIDFIANLNENIENNVNEISIRENNIKKIKPYIEMYQKISKYTLSFNIDCLIDTFLYTNVINHKNSNSEMIHKYLYTLMMFSLVSRIIIYFIVRGIENNIYNLLSY